MPDKTKDSMIRVGTLDEVKKKGCMVVSGEDRPIAVFYHEDEVRAVDNRCPHMGFPLHKGTVTDGILTCHWHHARFDLSSGCTFDLFADDVPTCATEIRDGEVWIENTCHYADELGHWRRRLEEGMSQNIPLIIAKAVIGLLKAGVDYRDIVREGILFGSRYRDGWGPGATILIAMANLVPHLPEDEKFMALYQGLRRVAGDCAGQVPRRDRHPLESKDLPHETLERWFRYWTLVRHRDGAERTILTAIRNGMSQTEVADILFAAATDRYYADVGHALDFTNKAFEATELIGWQEAEQILPTIVRQLVAARGGEEMNSWRHPVDLMPPLEKAFEQLPTWFSEGEGKTWNGEAQLAQDIMSNDPSHVVDSLGKALAEGARAAQLSKALCYAAALRIARFGTANEFGDWITALHTFTYCNALHQGVKRVADGDGQGPEQETVRGVFHGAISVYLDRFLNVPPAHLPTERGSLEDEPTDASELLEKFLDVLDSRQQVDEAGKTVARYLSLNHPLEPLVATFARGVLREDADFHTFQMLEASLQQYREWGNTNEGKNILIALARYMAAHSPTERAQLQTADIALRLHRGDSLYEEDEEVP